MTAVGLPSFNEAGAVMPRKGRDDIRQMPEIWPCFNEAGAVMPRKGVSQNAGDLLGHMLQ